MDCILLKRACYCRKYSSGTQLLSISRNLLGGLGSLCSKRQYADKKAPAPGDKETPKGDKRTMWEKERTLTPAEIREKYTLCSRAKRRSELKCQVFPWKAIDYFIDAQSCFGDPCGPGAPEKLDKKMYKPSDKATRKYMQTWIECRPDSPRQPKHKLRIRRPKIERRIFPPCPVVDEKPKTACPQDDGEKMEAIGPTETQQKKPPPIVELEPKTRGKCIMVRLAGCYSARKNKSCRPQPRPTFCPNRRLPPYPSFSECKKAVKYLLPEKECGCLDQVPMCAAYEEFRRRQRRK